MIKDVEGLGAEEKFRPLPDEGGCFLQRQVEIGMTRAMEGIATIGSVESQRTGAGPDTSVRLKCVGIEPEIAGGSVERLDPSWIIGLNGTDRLIGSDNLSVASSRWAGLRR